jgi:glyoxylase-like metal-dependent hydrolase (beta-lactamase superfamily II)
VVDDGSGYRTGVRQLTEGVHAYLQPDGNWGLSNAGLIRGSDSALLVDTLFDAPRTREMLAALRPLTDETPIGLAVNTHGDGDHWFGNHELGGGVDLVASDAAVGDMHATGPEVLGALAAAELEPPLRDYARRVFGAFEFGSVTPRRPSQTFSGSLDIDVGGTRVRLIEVGPAHTAGDTLVHVPGAATVFTGDILFIGGTPVIWYGPVSHWIAACDEIVALRAEHIVPGHGPPTDADGVRSVRDYLEFVRDEAALRHAAGMPPAEAAADIELGRFAGLLAPERIVVNVDRVYHELDPERPLSDKLAMFDAMAHYDARRRGAG